MTNNRIGIGTVTPSQPLDVIGNANVANLSISGNSITSESTLDLTGSGVNLGANGAVTLTGGTSGQVLSTDGSGALSWIDSANVSALLGNTIEIGTPTDGDLTSNVAYDGWTTATVVTDGLDDLNQVSLNIANGTFVGQVEFVGNPVAGPSPQAVSFTGSLIGTATNYLWDFGDGNSATTLNATNTYTDSDGGQFTVTLTAYNTDGTYAGNVALGAKGSVDSNTKQIILHCIHQHQLQVLLLQIAVSIVEPLQKLPIHQPVLQPVMNLIGVME